jgi:thiosulfate/3-mercaptopyruvate sulfurtransferase
MRWVWLGVLVVALTPIRSLAESIDRRAFPEPDLLLEPEELARPEIAEKFVVLDARKREEYQRGHVPGARHVDHDAWEKAFQWETGAPRALEKTFDEEQQEAWKRRIGELGISPGSEVVVYDDAGMTNAARTWWILRYWGVQKARLLNGGWDGWKAADLPVSEEIPKVEAVEFRAEPRTGLLATKDNVLEMLRNPQWQIVDARSWKEHCGLDAGKNRRAGAIPGAKHLEWSDLIDQKTHRFKSPDELRRLFERAGISLDRPTATHCGSGGRASVMAFGLELMGAEHVRNYYRGWTEWGNTDDTPVVKPEGRQPAQEK